MSAKSRRQLQDAPSAFGRKGGKATQERYREAKGRVAQRLRNALNDGRWRALRTLADLIIDHVHGHKVDEWIAAGHGEHLVAKQIRTWRKSISGTKKDFSSKAHSPEVRAQLLPLIKAVSNEEGAWLLDLWATDEQRLQRLRRCEYERCPTPYFFDDAPASHGRFCHDTHRVMANREGKMDPTAGPVPHFIKRHMEKKRRTLVAEARRRPRPTRS